MGRLVSLRGEVRKTCPACTDDMVCVACFLDMKQLTDMEDDRVIELEGYIDG